MKKLTLKQQKHITYLCNKLVRLTSLYGELRKEKRQVNKQLHNELSSIKNSVKRKYIRQQLDKWNKAFYTRYKIINTEVKHVISALEKHAVKCPDKQKSIIKKLCYRAITA
jgi:hypothetical protein